MQLCCTACPAGSGEIFLQSALESMGLLWGFNKNRFISEEKSACNFPATARSLGTTILYKALGAYLIIIL